MKNRLFYIAYKLGLLNHMESILFQMHRIKNKKLNEDFKKIHYSFPWPSNRLLFDLYGHVHYPYYHFSGMEDAGLICKILLKHEKKKSLNILDWGCGTGRVLYHLPEFLPQHRLKIFGTECNRASVEWCRIHYPNSTFSLNTLDPPLHYPDACFDAIYGLSVIPHLSAQRQNKWCRELYRVLKKDGILIISTEGKSETCFHNNAKEGHHRRISYHSQDYIKDTLLQGSDIVEHFDSSSDKYSQQDFWVARKP